MLNPASREFERSHGVRFVEQLGSGKDGHVLATDRNSAVKFFYNLENYNRELRAYRACEVSEVEEIQGHHVPRLLCYDDMLRAIEMTIVTIPYLLDFAAAYTEDEVERFAFDDSVMAERNQHWSEIFGDKWPNVVSICDEFFDKTGFILLDLSLNNVRFR